MSWSLASEEEEKKKAILVISPKKRARQDKAFFNSDKHPLKNKIVFFSDRTFPWEMG